MHLGSEMLTLVPSNAITSAAQQPSSFSPTMTAIPSNQFGAFSFAGLQAAANLGCIQGTLGGFPLSAIQSLNGYSFTGLPATCGLASGNGYTIAGVNGTPTSNCGIAGCTTSPISGITINGVTMAPPNALTAPEVYGLPSTATHQNNKSPGASSSTSSGPDSPSSGETSPAPLTPAQSWVQFVSLAITSNTVVWI